MNVVLKERLAELELDGDLVWSKLETGEWPDHGEMIAAIRERL